MLGRIPLGLTKVCYGWGVFFEFFLVFFILSCLEELYALVCSVKRSDQRNMLTLLTLL